MVKCRQSILAKRDCLIMVVWSRLYGDIAISCYWWHFSAAPMFFTITLYTVMSIPTNYGPAIIFGYRSNFECIAETWHDPIIGCKNQLWFRYTNCHLSVQSPCWLMLSLWVPDYPFWCRLGTLGTIIMNWVFRSIYQAAIFHGHGVAFVSSFWTSQLVIKCHQVG